MVKKILTILTTALCCVSCGEITFRESDVFVVKGVELNEYREHGYKYQHLEHKHKYRYYLQWKKKYYGSDKTFIDEAYFYSDEKYKLGDTLQIKIRK